MKQEQKKEPELSVRQAAVILKVGVDTVYALLWSLKLDGEKRDGKWVVAKAAVEERLRRREKARGESAAA